MKMSVDQTGLSESFYCDDMMAHIRYEATVKSGRDKEGLYCTVSLYDVFVKRLVKWIPGARCLLPLRRKIEDQIVQHAGEKLDATIELYYSWAGHPEQWDESQTN